jgi:hypothetical protein
MVALLKLNKIEEFIKNGGIFNNGGLFNESVSEAKQVEGKAAQEVLREFLILMDPVSQKSLYKNL